MGAGPGMNSSKYRHFLSRPSAAYVLLLTSLIFLVGIGMLMVLSASSVTSIEKTGTTYSIFLKQLLFLFIGIGLFVFGYRAEQKVWLKISRLAMPVSLALLLLPQSPLGLTINGGRSWIAVGPFTFQPSEIAKLGLVLFFALQLTRLDQAAAARGEIEASMKDIIYHIVPAAILGLAFIMLGKDLGDAIVLMAILGALLFISGIPLSQFSALSASGLGLVALFVLISPYRKARFVAITNPFAPAVYKLTGWQTAHAVMGLASGGFFGVGLGASRQKWANLSEANTDFIFSVLGEELGLLGTLSVLALYAILIYAIFRTAIHAPDLYTKYVCAGIGAWFLLQLTINVASSIGIFPVVGITLPFMSYGGSALTADLLAISFVVRTARQAAQAESAREVAG
jgi:cell division protein FtsW